MDSDGTGLRGGDCSRLSLKGLQLKSWHLKRAHGLAGEEVARGGVTFRAVLEYDTACT